MMMHSSRTHQGGQMQGDRVPQRHEPLSQRSELRESQVRPHPPQLFMSSRVLTHVVPQQVSVAAQVRLQAPQWATLFVVLTH